MTITEAEREELRKLRNYAKDKGAEVVYVELGSFTNLLNALDQQDERIAELEGKTTGQPMRTVTTYGAYEEPV